ncbi:MULTISPECIES: hypothetical protein [Bacillaceae]|uniref:Uncharacterized protein n=1 Tax=Evansella alkalicola TaxID=745819 RepID=A0ABS6JVJ1_9BACI|nr:MULTISPECIES: hypothetical protein [Bacillaceae]MBU9722410.1 hypothetical protein [Bacillus alkalicola]
MSWLSGMVGKPFLFCGSNQKAWLEGGDGLRTKGKRMKLEMSADGGSADKRPANEGGNVRRIKVSGQMTSE